MSKAPRRVVIVGGSLAALRTAEGVRNAGFDGEVIVIGEESHQPYDRPPLSKDILAGRRSIDASSLEVPYGIENLGVEWRLGVRATGLDVDRRHVQVVGEEVPFDRIVIATGARPRSIRGMPPAAGVHLLRTLDDCLALRTELEARPRVVIVGAGFIGLEVAATCSSLGLDVTLIETLAVPLEPILGAEVGARIAELHGEHGVRVRSGVALAGLEGEHHVGAVTLTDGSQIDADLVVLGIGVTPNVEWLADSGLELRDGVVCDTTCRAMPNVYAAGDVARWMNPRFGESMRVEHWSNAVEQGLYVGRRLLEPDETTAAPFDSVPFFWSDQYDKKFQFVGTSRGYQRAHVLLETRELTDYLVVYERDGVIIGALGVNCAPLLLPLRAAMGACSVDDVTRAVRSGRTVTT